MTGYKGSEVHRQSLFKTETFGEGLNSTPLVSVVLTAYNHSQYLKESLDSVVNTTHRRLEIVIIDDASNDNTDAIIQEWLLDHRDHKVTYIAHEQNRGLTYSLNQGIGLAQGQLIYFSSADDVVLAEGVTKLVNYLSEHPDKLAVFADCHVINLDGEQIYESGIEGLNRRSGMRKSMLEIDSLLPFTIFFHWGICGPSFMMRKETFSVVGPYDEQLAMDDWDMYLRLAALGKLGFCNDYVGKYRLHGQNTSITNRSGIIRDAIRVGRKHSPRFRGITSLRLAGLTAFLRYSESKSVPGRLFYFTTSGALLFLSNYIHRAFRLILFFRHKYFES